MVNPDEKPSESERHWDRLGDALTQRNPNLDRNTTITWKVNISGYSDLEQRIQRAGVLTMAALGCISAPVALY